MDKLDMRTENIVDGNIEKIAKLFPNCITEGYNEEGELVKMVDFDLLKQELSKDVVEGNDERYTLNWPGKKQAILTANAPINATLRPCPEESVDFDNTKNLYIEGDNLEVLKLLRETYLNKIKMIYIDPPYNTGNDFVYNDDFATSTDEYLEASKSYDELGNRMFQNNDSNGRFHSDWLSMMYSRLRLAKDLLSDDGVIFMSIDDNEVSNLQKLCNEIFSENNFVALLAVENNPKGRKNSKFISVCNDYCLIYAKNVEQAYFIENVPKSLNDVKEDENGNFVHNSGKRVLVGEQKFNKPVKGLESQKHYSVYYNLNQNKMVIKKEASLEDQDSELTASGYDRYISYCGNNFVENTYTAGKLQELFESGALEFKNNKIYEKNLSTTIRLKSMLVNKNYKAIINGMQKDFSMDFKTTSAGTELKELFGIDEVLFSAPKNVGLLKVLITLFDSKELTVLDFFSGSATSAHAVMSVNAEDYGKRKFICVQLPEMLDESDAAYKYGYRSIPDIAKERIRRAGQKIVEQQAHLQNAYAENKLEPMKAYAEFTTSDKALKAQEDIKKKLDIGFRVLKLDSSCMKDVYYSPAQMNQSLLTTLEDNIKEDRTAEDLLFQVMLDMGVVLSSDIKTIEVAGKKVFNVNDGNLVCCFDKNLTDEVVTEIAKLQPLYAVFRDASMSTDSVAVNFDQIFETYSPTTTRRVI